MEPFRFKLILFFVTLSGMCARIDSAQCPTVTDGSEDWILNPQPDEKGIQYCYRYFSEAKTWDEARQTCQEPVQGFEYQPQLMFITSEEEKNYFNQLSDDLGLSTEPVLWSAVHLKLDKDALNFPDGTPTESTTYILDRLPKSVHVAVTLPNFKLAISDISNDIVLGSKLPFMCKVQAK